MEVHVRPELQAKLTRLAAIERLVVYDRWFIGEVEKGLAQIERGEVMTHEEVGSRLERRLTDKHSAV